MKRLFFAAALLVCFSCNKEEKDLVPAIPGTMLQVIKEGNSGNEGIINKFVYNEAGNITSRIDYFADKISSQADITYKNGLAHIIDTKMDVSSSTVATNYIYSKAELEYDSNKRIIQKKHFRKSGNSYELVSFSVYDYSGSLIVKESKFMEDGTAFQYTNYQYDTYGNVTRSESYQRNGQGELKLAQSLSYTHDLQLNNPYQKVYLPVENIPFSVNAHSIIKTSGITTMQTTYTGKNAFQFPLEMEENNSRFLFQYN